jgi:hypothetical protein
MTFEVSIGPGFQAAVERQMEPIIRQKIGDLHSLFNEEFRGPKSGKIYRRPEPLSGLYRASAPGQPPAIASSNLLLSIEESFPDRLTGQITIGAPYAGDLERGTNRIRPRPWIRPAIDRLINGFRRIGGQ